MDAGTVDSILDSIMRDDIERTVYRRKPTRGNYCTEQTSSMIEPIGSISGQSHNCGHNEVINMFKRHF